MVGNFRRFNRGRSADKSQGKERNRGVAGAGDIENLSCLRWNVMRRFVLLKEHHPVFAEGDEDIFGFPFLENRFTGAPEIGIFLWSFVRFAPGNA